MKAQIPQEIQNRLIEESQIIGYDTYTYWLFVDENYDFVHKNGVGDGEKPFRLHTLALRDGVYKSEVKRFTLDGREVWDAK
ncbi:unnamed protein product [Cunninghamella echinulata]